MRGVIKVAALKQLELTAAEHKVERQHCGTAEVLVCAGQNVEVCWMEPELPNGGLCASTVPFCNELAD